MPPIVEIFCITINLLLSVIGWLIVARALLGIFVSEDDGMPVYNFCFAVTEPIVSPVREALFKVDALAESGLDLSNFATFFLIMIAQLCLSMIP